MTKKKNNIKKENQLGMKPGTASGQLRKMILFKFVKELSLDKCYRCKEPITNIEDLSIEHKVPYLDSPNPKKLFFDLENIAFSHLICNGKARRITNRATEHGLAMYKNKCRCEICVKANYDQCKYYRKKKKLKTGRDRTPLKKLIGASTSG